MDNRATVRRERKEDFRRTEEAARDAFWNLYVPGASEHYIVHTMRTHTDFLADLSFVLDIDGRVEGGIFYTRSRIVTPQGIRPTVSFGPVFVAPPYQRQGLGRMLITRSLAQARDAGFSAVLILGNPQHYASCGFSSAKTFGISMPDGQYHAALLALPLQEGALEHCRGHVEFSSVLYPQEKDVQAFDSAFPFREKRLLPCRQAYKAYRADEGTAASTD